MKWKCISCNITWGEECSDNDYSHGLCVDCFKEKIAVRYHTEQLKYSGNPCFGTSVDGNCIHTECKYREICLDTLKR